MKLTNYERKISPDMDHREKKKQEKKNSIIKSGFQLFISKGFSKTSIDEIVKGANLAKGTFYLYFKDKENLLDEIVYNLCFEAVGSALKSLDEEQKKYPDMEIGDGVCFFAERLLDILMENKDMLPIIHKNLSKGLYAENKKAGTPLSLRCENSVIINVVEKFQNNFEALGGTIEEARKRLYMIVEIVNSVAYNALIECKPYGFEEIRPLLLKTIRCLAYPQFN